MESRMKIQPKFYHVQVESGQDRAVLICLTYHLDSAGKFSGVEFYEIVFTTHTQFSIPSSKVATFQEELRALHQAGATFGGDRTNESGFIEQKLKEAYGKNATIHIEQIQPKA